MRDRKNVKKPTDSTDIFLLLILWFLFCGEITFPLESLEKNNKKVIKLKITQEVVLNYANSLHGIKFVLLWSPQYNHIVRWINGLRKHHLIKYTKKSFKSLIFFVENWTAGSIGEIKLIVWQHLLISRDGEKSIV